MADMVAQNEAGASSCSLLSVNANFSLYQELNLFHGGDDSHSTLFLRVLRDAVHGGAPLSPSCQKIIDDNKDKYDFYKKCFDDKSLAR